MKPTPAITCWAVRARGRAPSTRSWIVPFTVQRRRTDALAAFLAMWDRAPASQWDYWRRRGYRLVKVTVIVQGDGNA